MPERTQRIFRDNPIELLLRAATKRPVVDPRNDTGFHDEAPGIMTE